MMLRSLLAASAIAAVGGNQADVPPILDPAPYTAWTSTSSDGLSRRADVEVPFTNSTGSADFVTMLRVDLVGDAAQRGQAQGELVSQGGAIPSPPVTASPRNTTTSAQPHSRTTAHPSLPRSPKPPRRPHTVPSSRPSWWS